MKLTPDKKASIAEAAITQKLSWSDFILLEPRVKCRYDFAVDVGSGRIIRLQVKWGRYENGSIVFNTSSISPYYHKIKPKKRRPYTEKEIDFFAVYCPYNNEAYFIPVRWAPKTSMRLRLDKPKNSQEKGINWAEDFTVEGLLKNDEACRE